MENFSHRFRVWMQDASYFYLLFTVYDLEFQMLNLIRSKKFHQNLLKAKFKT